MVELTSTVSLDLFNDSSILQLIGQGQILQAGPDVIEIQFGTVTALVTGDFTLGLDSFISSVRVSLDGTQFLLLDGLNALFNDFAGAFDIETREAVYRTIFTEADNLSGSDLADTLGGFEGADRLEGRGGNDNLLGGLGDDVLIGGAGADFHDGGDGIDTASFQGSIQRNLADLQGLNAGQGDAAGDVFTNVENLIGGNRVDILFGDAGANAISGGSGSDRVAGRAGDDVLDGGAGFDKLYGNAGQDIMTGGGGNDRFIYFNLSDSRTGAGSRDVITDFEVTGDRIEIQRLDADAGSAGDQSFDFIGRAGFSGVAGELRYFQSVRNDFTIIQGDVDGDGAQDFQIELSGLIDLNAGDFAL